MVKNVAIIIVSRFSWIGLSLCLVLKLFLFQTQKIVGAFEEKKIHKSKTMSNDDAGSETPPPPGDVGDEDDYETGDQQHPANEDENAHYSFEDGAPLITEEDGQMGEELMREGDER